MKFVISFCFNVDHDHDHFKKEKLFKLWSFKTEEVLSAVFLYDSVFVSPFFCWSFRPFDIMHFDYVFA